LPSSVRLAVILKLTAIECETWSSYLGGLSSWCKFLAYEGRRDEFPPSVADIPAYADWAVNIQHIKPTTMLDYVAKISALCSRLFPGAKLSQATDLMKDLRRHYTRHYKSVKLESVPVTDEMIDKCVSYMNLNSVNDLTMRAMAYVGIDGIMRPTEFAHPGRGRDVVPLSALTPRWPWKKGSWPEQLKLDLEHTKTKNEGDDIFVGGAKALNAINAMLTARQQLRQSLDDSDPLFADDMGRAMSVKRFGRRMRELLKSAGFAIAKGARLSYRAGGATMMAKANVSDTIIKSAGRWKGDSSFKYIKDRGALRVLSRQQVHRSNK